MPRWPRLLALPLGIVLVAIASAQDSKSILVEGAWSRPVAAGAAVAVGYLVIRNNGPIADRLVGASSEIAGRVEIHESVEEGGVARMRPLPRGLDIAAGSTVKFEPRGHHLMFLELKRALRAGDRFRGTLLFEKAGPVVAVFSVEARAPMPHRGH
jgi:copper(I)-binding protein